MFLLCRRYCAVETISQSAFCNWQQSCVADLSKYSTCLEEGLDTGVLSCKAYKEGHREDYYQVEDRRFFGAEEFSHKVKIKVNEEIPGVRSR